MPTRRTSPASCVRCLGSRRRPGGARFCRFVQDAEAGPQVAASMSRTCPVSLMLLGLAGPSSADVPVSTVANLEFHSSFWVNLHHTLFAAAWAQRAETGTRRLVGPLPAPLTGQLSREERGAWDAAVGYYDREIADRDLRSRPRMTPIKRSLRRDISASAIRPELRACSSAPRRSIAGISGRRTTARIVTGFGPPAISCGRSSGTSWSATNGCMGGRGSPSPVRVDVVWVGRAYTTLDPVTHATVHRRRDRG